MASNYTEHIGLCQWEATDQVLRTEFNQDNAKVDAALDTLEQTLTQHSEELESIAKLGNCTVYHTTYTGKNQYSKSLTFPGKPMVVMVADTEVGNGFIAWRGMTVAIPFHQEYGIVRLSLSWETNSLSWSYEDDINWAMNASGTSYQVIGLLDMSV